jgi:hypothetical protein
MPNATLVEQLDLPQGRGLILANVPAGSPAAKAGLKMSDILLALDGQAVPSDLHRFAGLLAKIKTDTPVAAQVLRKGKKVTIRGVSLSAPAMTPLHARAGQGPLLGVVCGDLLPGGLSGPHLFMGPGMHLGVGPSPPPRDWSRTTIFQEKGRFTSEYQDSRVMILLAGTLVGGKAMVGDIRIQDGGGLQAYTSVARVPQRYRHKVKELEEQSRQAASTAGASPKP